MNELRTSTRLITAARRDGDVILASIAGEIDLNNSSELRTALFDLVARYRPQRMVLDLSRVPYMDSSAVAVLVELLRKLGKGPGRLSLSDLQPRVKGLLEIARLHTFFSVVSTAGEAGR